MDEISDDFDAADLADAILGLAPSDPDLVARAVVDPPTPSAPPTPPFASGNRIENTRGKAVGWVLLFLLFAAVSIAISLAVQLESGASEPWPPECNGLYSPCCDEWDDYRDPCRDICDPVPDEYGRDDRGGLFDAENDLVEQRLPSSC